MKIVALHTDKQLVELIKKDDEYALKVLFDKYFNPLCSFSVKITGNKQLAEEAVADTFIELWKKRSYLEITDNEKAYLFKMVRNISLNAIRKNNFETDSLNEDHIKQFSISPEQELISKENTGSIEGLLSALTEPAKTIFLMNREENFSYKEIAEILKISIKTVESHMGKALKLLRIALEKSSLKEFYSSKNGI